MAELRKFLFETEFDASKRHRDGSLTAEEPAVRARIEAARQEGIELGHQAGRREAEAEHARLEAETLTRIAKDIAVVGQKHAATLAMMQGETLALALAIGRKLAPRLMAAQPLAEIEGIVEDCLRRLLGEARIVIRIHGTLLDAMQSRIDALARRIGFAGQIILLAEDEVAPGDCRVEWADGGAVRQIAQLENEIDALIARLLGSPASAGKSPES